MPELLLYHGEYPGGTLMSLKAGTSGSSYVGGCLFVIAAALLWGTTGTSQVLAPAVSTPQEIGALRLLIGGVALAAYSIAKSRSCFKTISVLQALAGGFFVAAYQLCFFWGVSLTGVAAGTMVAIGSAPVFAGILDRLFLGTRPTPRWYISTFLALGGCIILALSDAITIDGYGIILSSGAGLSYGVYTLFMKKMLHFSPPESVAAALFCCGAVFLSPFLFSANLHWVFTPQGILITIHLGLLATAVSYLLFCKGLQIIPVSSAVTLSLTEPLTAGLLGVLFIGEKLSLSGWVGMLLILAGLIILTWPAGIFRRDEGRQTQNG